MATESWHTQSVISTSDVELDRKLVALSERLRQLDRIVVAFSGGADSAFLAAVAHRELGGDRVHAVTAISPSLAGSEEADCRALATEWGLRWTAVATNEMEQAAYRLNDGDRCYHCKAELMAVVGPIAEKAGATIVLGVNLDDLGDHRPGQRAAAEAGAAFPLVDAGFTKDDIRTASQALGLRTWDKPAAACLASRVPYGTAVTVGILSRVERAEAAMHQLGFRQCRVRHYDNTARIEVDPDAADGRHRRTNCNRLRRPRCRIRVRHTRPRRVPVRQPQLGAVLTRYFSVMLVVDIHHVSLNVSDTGRSLSFYRDVLGLAQLPRPNFPFGGAWLDAGNGRQVHLIEAKVPGDLGQHMAFQVTDLDGVVEHLRSAGVETPDPIPVLDTGIRQTFVSDPDGNRIEFTQPA